MNVSLSPRTPDHQAVPVLCTPNYGVCQPSLAWLHTWRGCPSAREDPDCSRPLHPPSSMAHTQKWTTSSSRLAITPLAAWNRKFLSAPSLSQPLNKSHWQTAYHPLPSLTIRDPRGNRGNWLSLQPGQRDTPPPSSLAHQFHGTLSPHTFKT